MPVPPSSEPVPLDGSQSTFCQLDHPFIRLLAPAGSGKTHSLLWRCKRLLERAEKPAPRFLVFTFTRAARDALRDRVRSDPQLCDLLPQLNITTLNSWGFKQLRAVATHPRLITSKADRYFCVQNVLQPVWRRHPAITTILEDSRRRNKAGQDLLTAVDFLKSMGFRHDRLETPDEFADHLRYLDDCGMRAQVMGFVRLLQSMELVRDEAHALTQVYTEFIPFWRETCQTLQQSALFSLEDQKYWARIEVERQVAEERYTTGGARHHHVLVDEFQDINPLDLYLLKAIAAHNKASLTIVGDDDQAIYEWRGATPAFILNPDQHLGGTYKTCILACNYRSPRNVVELSQRLIEHNQHRVSKAMRAARSSDALVEVRRFGNISSAINDTAALVGRLLDEQGCESVALISRKRSQIIPYQIVFAGKNRPFVAAEDLNVLLSDAFDELKGLLAIKARAGLGAIPGLDPVQDVLKLSDKIKRYPLSKNDRAAFSRYLYECNPASLREAVDCINRYTGPLKGGNADGRMSVEFSMAIALLLSASTVAEAVQALSEQFEGLHRDYGKSIEDIFYTDPPFLYLAEFASRYGADYSAFYRDIERAIATLARISADDPDVDPAATTTAPIPLHLMTALRAKGKEFDAVIVLDANDGIWPGRLARTEAELEQERRLFYVAMTRAKRWLYFVVNDSILGAPVTPSPYLREMGLDLPSNSTVGGPIHA